jgi:hypothetical protein
MAKSAKAKRAKKTTATGTKANRATNLLSIWAKDRTPVEFVDRCSGLRYPGVIAETSSENLKAFQFFGHSGVTAGILPFRWTKVKIEKIGGTEALYVESKGGHRFGIHPDLTRRSPEDQVKRVRRQLAKWHEAQSEVHIYLSHAFYSLTFIGKIVRSDVAYFIERRRDSELRHPDLLVIELNHVICRIETKPVLSVVVLHVPTGCRLYVSEAEISPADLFKRFPLQTRLLQ